MAERSGFFPYVAGDANSEYDSAWLAKYIASIIGNGVYDGELAVTAGDGMAVTLPAGRAWINGYHYRNDGPLTLPVDNADGVLHRKDTVVLRWDVNARSITAQVLKGAPASSPVAPAIVRSAEQYDLKIAEISIPAGTTAITQSLITDTRLDNDVCGIVTGVVQQVDTTTLYQQIQDDLTRFRTTNEADFTGWSAEQRAAFDAWLQTMKDIPPDDAAAYLQNQINTINTDKLDTAEKAAPNGVATLNADSYLAQYVGAGRKSGTPIGANSTAEGVSTTAEGYGSHAEGNNTTASGNYSHAEGVSTAAEGYGSHAEGNNTTASGNYSHAEGNNTTASGNYSHAEGVNTTASGNYSHAEGNNTTAEGYGSHAEGGYTTASGDYSHAEGNNTTASGDYSHAEGNNTTAEVYGSHAQGLYNKQLNGDATSFSAASDAMVIGNGASVRSNCFRVTFGGKVYGLSAFNSSGADYSEFFEWADENPSADDRVGHFVTLDGEKIKYANDGDYIVGITSGSPAVIGDHPSESWNSRYLRDVFGRLQYEDVVIPAHEEKDKDGNVIRTVPEHTETHFKVNPDYDPAKEAEYENREKRPEWSTVGLMGKLVVIDDGTCTVNGYCKPKNGIATKADTGYRVMARLDETHIKVLMK